MKIDIGDHKYRITSDTRQYMLATYTGRKDKETGKDIVEYIGYYPKMDNLLKALFQKDARLSKAESLDQYMKDIQRIAGEVDKVARAMAQLIGKEAEFKKKLEAD